MLVSMDRLVDFLRGQNGRLSVFLEEHYGNLFDFFERVAAAFTKSFDEQPIV